MIARSVLFTLLKAALKRSRVVVLAGPRQSGKRTLARQLVSEDSINYFDLEDPASLARLEEPMTALRPLRGLVVIDEVQLRPDLFPVLRVLTDRDPVTPTDCSPGAYRDQIGGNVLGPIVDDYSSWG